MREVFNKIDFERGFVSVAVGITNIQCNIDMCR